MGIEGSMVEGEV